MSLELTYQKTGCNGTVALTAYLDDTLVAAQKLDVLKPAKRIEFVEKLCSDNPQIARRALDDQLTAIAAEILEPPKPFPSAPIKLDGIRRR